jgi:hypothetical protein
MDENELFPFSPSTIGEGEKRNKMVMQVGDVIH